VWLDPASITTISTNYILLRLFYSIHNFYLQVGGWGLGAGGLRTEKGDFLIKFHPFPFVASLHEAFAREQTEEILRDEREVALELC
jgi:hypothetical protein